MQVGKFGQNLGFKTSKIVLGRPRSYLKAQIRSKMIKIRIFHIN